MSEHSGLEFAPQSPRSQISHSMPLLVLFIISTVFIVFHTPKTLDNNSVVLACLETLFFSIALVYEILPQKLLSIIHNKKYTANPYLLLDAVEA